MPGILHDMLFMSSVFKRQIDESTVMFRVIIAGAGRGITISSWQSDPATRANRSSQSCYWTRIERRLCYNKTKGAVK